MACRNTRGGYVNAEKFYHRKKKKKKKKKKKTKKKKRKKSTKKIKGNFSELNAAALKTNPQKLQFPLSASTISEQCAH